MFVATTAYLMSQSSTSDQCNACVKASAGAERDPVLLLLLESLNIKGVLS